MTKSNIKRKPRFKVEFITDTNAFSVEYDDRATATNQEMEDRIIQFQTKNAMSDDSAVFQIVLFGDVFWDKVLLSNDIVKIYAKEDNVQGNGDDYQLILNGMISQVSIIGEHSNDKAMYRITGQSFSKPFLNFGLGVIQEVSAVLSADLGWLPDDKEEGIEFTGKTSAEVMGSALDRFVQYMKYNYDTGKRYEDKSLENQFERNLTSWKEYESLQDHTSLINFDGNFKQMLDLITCKPFNELFFRNGSKGKSELVLRRTPFDPSDWRQLPYATVTTDELITEDIGKSDIESYAVFNVTTPQQTKELKSELLSRPQTHRALRNRYGYKKLEAEFMFLPITDSDSTEEFDSEDNEDKGNKEITYGQLLNDLRDLGQERVGTDKDGVIQRMASQYRGLNKKTQAKKLVEEFIKSGTITPESFEEVTGVDPNKKPNENALDKFPSSDDLKGFMEDKYPSDKFKEKFPTGDDGKKTKDKNVTAFSKALQKEFPALSTPQVHKIINKYMDAKGNMNDEDYKELADEFTQRAQNAQETGANVGENAFSIFSKKLFNWYHANQNFYSGNITVLGSPQYDLGKRFIIFNKQKGENWEYYIESVEHNFDMQQGYTTAIGVTRGLRMRPSDPMESGSSERFKFLWGQSSDFLGGYLGEKSLTDLKKAGAESKQKGDSEGDSGDGSHSGGTLDGLEEYKGKLPTPRNKTDTSWTAPGNPNTGQWARECTWYAYNRRHELGLQAIAYGDAADWLSGAKSAGFKTGSTPKQGALVIWQRGAVGGSAQYGHVAFVEKVLDGGKSYRLSEYNYDTRKGYGERTVTMSSQIGKNGKFIYDK